MREPRTAGRGVLIAALCLLASACAGMMVPEGGSIRAATQEIGNSYVLDGASRVYACPQVMKNCFERSTGNFTVDESAIAVDDHMAIVHLVFDDGKAGWMGYNQFALAKPAVPAETRRVARLGMSTSDIRASWGAPSQSNDILWVGIPMLEWIYVGKGKLYFEHDKITKIVLSVPLLAP